MVLRVRKLPHRLASKTGRLLRVLLVRFGGVPSNPSRWRRHLLRFQNVGFAYSATFKDRSMSDARTLTDLHQSPARKPCTACPLSRRPRSQARASRSRRFLWTSTVCRFAPWRSSLFKESTYFAPSSPEKSYEFVFMFSERLATTLKQFGGIASATSSKDINGQMPFSHTGFVVEWFTHSTPVRP